MRALIALASACCAWLSSPCAAARETTSASAFSYAHVFGGLSYGRGFRFNNPYRLQTQLGEDAQSLSLTADYVDFALGATIGPPSGLLHGAVAHLSWAASGISQQVLSLSYLAEYALGRDVRTFGRIGVPIVLAPQVTNGLELGLGSVFSFTGALGASAELAFSLFQGAATWERSRTLWPVLSLQLGLYVDYEVLP